jgi:hypothetical protein
MTVSLFSAYADAREPIEAERMSQLAEVAMVPHLRPEAARSWWDAVAERMRSGVEVAAEIGKSLFTFNGQPVGFRELRRRLRGALGEGMHE